MKSWLTALRIARREARRAKGRSALVVAMIALPVLCLSFAAVTYDMFTRTPAERITRELGAADARVFWISDGQAMQDFEGSGFASRGQPKGPYTEAELLAALPPGSRIIADLEGEVDMRTAAGTGILPARGLDVADPLVAGRVTLLAGRAPASGDEVALTEQALDRLGAQVGGTVQLADGSRSYTVTGLVEFPDYLRPIVVFRPEALPPGTVAEDDTHGRSWLVDTPEPLTWAAVKELNQKGMLVRSRQVTLDPPPESEGYPELSSGPDVEVVVQQVGVGVLIFGLGVLEVVLLAGPAFAVGARRRARQLALVAANGGTPAHLRRIVLADGVVLGVVAAGVGVALGVAAAFAARPLIEEQVTQFRAGGYRVFPLALLGICGLAVVTGLLGALVPAFTAARQDVVAALAGRRGVTRSRKRWVLVGLSMCGLGAALAGFGAWTVNTTAVLAGLVVGELGVVLCTPALVGLIARFGRLLPLAPRIALRDTARNRAAAAPAISAVLAAVAGAVAIGVYLGSENLHWEQMYRPSMPVGHAALGYQPYDPATDRTQEPTPAAVENVRAALRDSIPVERMVDVHEIDCPAGMDDGDGHVYCFVFPAIPEQNMCPFFGREGPLSRAEQRAANEDPRCVMPTGGWSSGMAFGSVIVDDGTALPILADAPAEEIDAAAAVLRAGGAVVPNDLYLADGKVTLRVSVEKDGQDPTERDVTVPGYALRNAKASPELVLSPGALQLTGLGSRWTGVAASTTRMPTQAEEDRLRAAVEGASAVVERGPQTRNDPTLLILAIAAGVITLGAAGIATGLAAADGRADLTTLAAVGASPRLRRVLSLSQSGVIAGLGALLGAATGLGAATAVLFALNQAYAYVWPRPLPNPIIVPWATLGIVVVVVPLVAMLGAGLLTRSRLPIERRPAA
ncbi:MAG: FtsX-like permease family protein [Micromonosporaceae bacterium]